MIGRKKKAVKNLKQRSLITHVQPKAVISEQYRNVRTNIQFSSVDEDIKSLLVTSSGPSEGKSTTASNMAVVFAQQGKRVLLIDADLRKPTDHYTFKVENLYGLSTVLTKQKLLNECIQPTYVKNLSILTSGPIPPNPSELLVSRRMERLIEEAKTQFDIVIFDTPPVLAVADAQILANKVDGIVFVVRSEQTEIESAVKAKNILSGAKGKLLGVVLNGREQQESNYYYYYGNK
ncbi:MAG: CpsD/CapB family tyrosine-protein kinase [Bacillaceae bacterium]